MTQPPKTPRRLLNLKPNQPRTFMRKCEPNRFLITRDRKHIFTKTALRRLMKLAQVSRREAMRRINANSSLNGLS